MILNKYLNKNYLFHKYILFIYIINIIVKNTIILLYKLDLITSSILIQ